MRDDTDIFCLSLGGAAWKWHCHKPGWCLLSKREELHMIREGKHTLAEHGASSHQMKRLLWHEPDLSLPPSSPRCIKVKPLGFVTKIFLYLTTLQCHLQWGTLQLSCPLGVREPWHFLPWDVPWVLTCKSMPIREGLCPRHSEWAFWNCCLQALHPSYHFPWCYSSCGTILGHWPKSSSTGSRKTEQQNDKLGTSEEQGTSRRCP